MAKEETHHDDNNEAEAEEMEEATVEKTDKPSSHTSSDTQGVLGKKKGAALDAGGDKDVGKLKEEDELEEAEGELEEAEGELEEAEGEKLHTPSATANDSMRPDHEKGDNMPTEKG